MTDSLILELRGFVLQLAGVAVLFVSNAVFYRRARKLGFGSFRKGFVDLVSPRLAYSSEELRKADAEEALKKFPLAALLFENYRDSFIGIVLTLLGVVISGIGLLA